jgi:hypothetical protein
MSNVELNSKYKQVHGGTDYFKFYVANESSIAKSRGLVETGPCPRAESVKDKS